jgi:multidrug resistance efflux pump
MFALHGRGRVPKLAQRVPLRIAIDQVPSGVPLVSGLSATVTIKDEAVDANTQSSFWLGRVVGQVWKPDCRMP